MTREKNSREHGARQGQGEPGRERGGGGVEDKQRTSQHGKIIAQEVKNMTFYSLPHPPNYKISDPLKNTRAPTQNKH